jgi:tRNA (guanine-N7-)-methyltransferase
MPDPTDAEPSACAPPGDCFPDWPRDFGRQGPQRLELEIGSGRGSFALQHALAHPELDLVAVEQRRSDAEWLRLRASKHRVQNLIVLQGDARLLLPRCFAPAELCAVHIQFPDPWWKQRHRRRRLVDVELARELRSLLRAGGEVDFRTDVPAYAQAALETWEEAGYRNLDGNGAFWAGTPETLSTRERRYAATGQPVFRLRLVNPGPMEPGQPVPGAGAMGRRTGREWADLRRK